MRRPRILSPAAIGESHMKKPKPDIEHTAEEWEDELNARIHDLFESLPPEQALEDFVRDFDPLGSCPVCNGTGLISAPDSDSSPLELKLPKICPCALPDDDLRYCDSAGTA
jgi:hypothetical protein